MKRRACLLPLLALVFLAACGGGDDDTDNESPDDDADDGPDLHLQCDDSESVGEVWTDPATSIIWQTGRSCDDRTFDDAISYCESLNLGNYADWRLPTVSELRTLINGCYATIPGGECGVTDECSAESDCYSDVCWGCSSGTGCHGPSDMLLPCGMFWSSTPTSEQSKYPWCVGFGPGAVFPCHQYYDEESVLDYEVRCTRP